MGARALTLNERVAVVETKVDRAITDIREVGTKLDTVETKIDSISEKVGVPEGFVKTARALVPFISLGVSIAAIAFAGKGGF